MTNERFNLIAICVIVIFVVICTAGIVLSRFTSSRLLEIEEERTEILKDALKTGRHIVWVVNERCLAEAVKDAENESN